MALVQFNFESEYLNNNHTISVILPDKPRGITAHDFYGSGKKYKVLWLLHGTFGDYSDWLRRSNVERYAEEKTLLLSCRPDRMRTMPTGQASESDIWHMIT